MQPNYRKPALTTLTCALLFTSFIGSQADEQDTPIKTKTSEHPFRTGECRDLKGHTWSVVKANGITLFGVPVAAGGFTRQQRVGIISDRLGRAYNRIALSDPGSYRIEKMNHQTTVCISNPEGKAGLPTTMLVITIDSNFEKMIGHKRLDIAYYWRDLMADNLKRAHVKEFSLENRKDFLGRPLDPDTTWLNVPDGYADHAH